ncbi:hypothetical protein OPT61_g1995 [Boeremia exigua]|uniref:Uncharacterized protein n=1 Tax=Boeremia exigua TaxID=749465 RepID=A0ACC2INC1_9PLEO|nr:hypothetical protein OPT61_g1995 [Boeremia exigua]
MEEEPSRLDNEIELLTAIFPDQITYSSRSRELKFTQEHATLQLRIPDAYPGSGLPDVLGATDAAKYDIRTQTKAAVQALNLPAGEEALDAIISAFQQVVSERVETASNKPIAAAPSDTLDANTSKTVIIWLHHLLNTNKRKLCLSPAFSGITKPGYPGVLIYSGPAAAVDAHVGELKAQNWAAFQVRFEEEVEWKFAHSQGVREVESMADVVKLVDFDADVGKAEGRGGQGQRQKEEFLKAVPEAAGIERTSRQFSAQFCRGRAERLPVILELHAAKKASYQQHTQAVQPRCRFKQGDLATSPEDQYRRHRTELQAH